MAKRCVFMKASPTWRRRLGEAGIRGVQDGSVRADDFIGNDINFAATRSVFEGTYYNPRYKPFLTQQG